MTPARGARSKAGLWALIALSAGVMTLGAVGILGVAAATLFRARSLYAKLATTLARFVLRLWGISVVLHGDQEWPRQQTVFISNHPSTLDLFVLVALGLPRTRFFLSGFLQKYVPLGIIARLMGTFFTVPQQDQAGRRRIFAAAADTLRRTGESVYLSPEGGRYPGNAVGPFNKGAFHLAASLGAPILPLLFVIPSESDPGMGYDARPGTVHVHVGPPIDTRTWQESDIGTHRDAVRRTFQTWQQSVVEAQCDQQATRTIGSNPVAAIR